MGISNYIPNSRLAQAGVCTFNTRPVSPYEGQIIYETDTNRVLVWDASAWVMIADADTPPGLELIKTQTVGSAVSSVTVSDVFSSTYDNYKIIYNNFTASTNGSLTMQLNNSTGATYQLTGIYLTVGITTVNGYGPSAATKWTDVSPAGTTPGYWTMDIFCPFLSVATRARTTGNTASGYYDFGALDTSTNSSTGFVLSHGTGGATLTGGTIRVYGYRN